MRFWRAGTGHVRGGGQYDLMESVSAKGGFEPASELTSKQVRSKIESYGFGLRSELNKILWIRPLVAVCREGRICGKRATSKTGISNIFCVTLFHYSSFMRMRSANFDDISCVTQPK